MKTLRFLLAYSLLCAATLSSADQLPFADLVNACKDGNEHVFAYTDSFGENGVDLSLASTPDMVSSNKAKQMKFCAAPTLSIAHCHNYLSPSDLFPSFGEIDPKATDIGTAFETEYNCATMRTALDIPLPPIRFFIVVPGANRVMEYALGSDNVQPARFLLTAMTQRHWSRSPRNRRLPYRLHRLAQTNPASIIDKAVEHVHTLYGRYITNQCPQGPQNASCIPFGTQSILRAPPLDTKGFALRQFVVTYEK